MPEASRHYRLTEDGQRWFKDLGIDPRAYRIECARPCMDWTERRHHLAGLLGTALLHRFFELKWVAHIEQTRAVRITHEGQRQLGNLLGIEASGG